MPYCSHCNYWTRHPVEAAGAACPNCGEPPEQIDSSEKFFQTKAGFLLFLAAFAFLLGVLAAPLLGAGPAAAGISLSALLVYWSVTSESQCVIASEQRGGELANSQEMVFTCIEESLQDLNHHASEIQSLLESEGPGPHSDRAQQRHALLREALEHRRARIDELSVDLWTREVQLWLNQLEGFLAAELPRLDRNNAESIHAHFKRLVASAHSLHTRGAALELNGIMPQRAWRVLEDCLAKAPEFEDRVRDAQALAVLGEDCELPTQLEPEGSWLHWLQEAIPTIELLPPEFTEDDAYLRVQTQLRLLRDGVKYPESGSLDRAADSLDQPSSQTKFERE
jgi:hypothetical protein